MIWSFAAMHLFVFNCYEAVSICSSDIDTTKTCQHVTDTDQAWKRSLTCYRQLNPDQQICQRYTQYEQNCQLSGCNGCHQNMSFWERKRNTKLILQQNYEMLSPTHNYAEHKHNQGWLSATIPVKDPSTAFLLGNMLIPSTHNMPFVDGKVLRPCNTDQLLALPTSESSWIPNNAETSQCPHMYDWQNQEQSGDLQANRLCQPVNEIPAGWNKEYAVQKSWSTMNKQHQRPGTD